MGQMCSGQKDFGGSKEDKDTNAKIETQIRKDKKAIPEIKLLLLGAGESGKSTIAKQLKIIFLNGYSKQELLSYKGIVHSNIIMGMRAIVLEVRKRGLSVEGSIEDKAELIVSQELLMDQQLTPAASEAIQALWKDAAIQEVYNFKHEYQVTEAIAYYIKGIARIAADNYVPTEDDILQSRARTIGIKEMTFELQGYNWRIVDVGGQRNERKKWIHCFEDVTSIIFCVDAACWNQTLLEDNRVNRMLESLTLFDEICNCRYFDTTPLMLFMNKCDLLKKKIRKYKLKDYFEDYDGGHDSEAAYEWLKQKFLKLNKNSSKTLYVHPTCATSTDNIRFVFKAVEDIIINETLQKNRLM